MKIKASETIDRRAEHWIGDVRFNLRYSRKTAQATNAIGMTMGRFGGGWDWKLGFQAGGLKRGEGTIVCSLLVADVTFSWATRAVVEKREEVRLKWQQQRDQHDPSLN